MTIDLRDGDEYNLRQLIMWAIYAAAIFKTITVGKSPEGIAVNPETNMIYVPNGDSNSTSVIDGKTNKVVPHVTVGNDPHVIAINPKNNMVYVTNFGGGEGITNTVSEIDGNTNKVVANVTVGSSPHSVAVNPTTDMVYVTNDDNGTVSDSWWCQSNY